MDENIFVQNCWFGLVERKTLKLRIAIEIICLNKNKYSDFTFNTQSRCVESVGFYEVARD